MPVIFAAVPLTSTGKIDKKSLKQVHQNHYL